MLLLLWGMALASVALIFAATLFPFDFEFRPPSVPEYFRGFRYRPSGFRDVPENIVLFLPFGYCLAALLSRSPRFVLVLFRTGYAAFFLSLLVETLQMFLSSRAPNVSDIASNTTGALIGAGAFRLLRARAYWKERFVRGISIPSAALLLASFFALTTLFFSLLSVGMRLADWDPTFRLCLGNELTEGRPWSGSLRDLVFLDCAVPPADAENILGGELPPRLFKSALASYPLSGAQPWHDSFHRSPAIRLASAPEETYGGTALHLGNGTWAVSTSAVSTISSRINENGQFTVAFTAATSNSAQFGPARIISISLNPHHRNLTLGQEGSDLALRWRSPLQGRNGSSAQLLFPGVFRHSTPQRLVLTFDGATVALYRSGSPPVSLLLTPGLGLSALLYEGRTHSVSIPSFSLWAFDLILCLVASAVFGILLERLARSFNNRASYAGFLMTFAIGLPLLQEGILASFQHRPLRWEPIVISFALISMTIWTVARFRRSPVSPAVASAV